MSLDLPRLNRGHHFVLGTPREGMAAPGATAGSPSSVNGSKDKLWLIVFREALSATANFLHDLHCWTSQQWHPRAAAWMKRQG